MRFLTLAELIDLHSRIIDQTGGVSGLRGMGRLESAIAQPRMSFGGRDLYPTLIEKAAGRNLLELVDHLRNNTPSTYWESQLCNPFTSRQRRRLVESMGQYADRLERGEFPFEPELSGGSG